MRKTLTALGTVLAAAAPAAAQEPFVLDEIVFAANLGEVETLRTGASVEVVTEEDLEQTAETRVADYLARLPGVNTLAQGPIGSQTGLTIRGVSQTNIAVRIDGIDVTDPSGPQVAYDFGSLTTMDISRIEVLKGSQSALYGSEAIGGVIDITTKRATAIGVEQSASAEVGSYNTKRANYTFAAKGDAHELAFSLNHVDSDGYSAADENDGNLETDAFRSNRLSFYSDYQLQSGTKLIFSGFAEDTSYDYDESGPVDGTPDEVTENRTLGLRSAVQFATGSVDNQLEATVFEIERNLTGTNAFGPFNFTYKGERRRVGYQGAVDLSVGQLVVGAESVKESYDNFGSGAAGYESRVNSIFGELNFSQAKDVDVTATARLDDHSQFGTYATGRLAAVYRAREDLIFRATVANGYRAPSNYELFDPFAGNAALEPEKSISADFGIEKSFGTRVMVEATAFYIEAEDLIDYSNTTFSYYQAKGVSRRKGLELSANWTLDDGTTFWGAYTFTDSDTSAVLDSSSWLTSSPRHQLAFEVDYPITSKLDATLTGLYGSERPNLPDMSVFGATLAYAVNDTSEAYLRVENISDSEYQTVPGYGTSDRAFYVGLRASF